MLAIRMQRTGRKGHAMFRMVVQDSRRTPTSGKIVTQIGSYDPHNKSVTLDKEKAAFYLEHGAQPSDRVTLLLKKEGVKLPKWVSMPDKQEGKTRNPDKRRSTRPEEPESKEQPTEQAEQTAEEPAEEKPAEEAPKQEVPAAEAPAESPEDKKDEKPEDKSEEKSDEKTEEEPSEASEEEKTEDQKTTE